MKWWRLRIFVLGNITSQSQDWILSLNFMVLPCTQKLGRSTLTPQRTFSSYRRSGHSFRSGFPKIECHSVRVYLWYWLDCGVSVSVLFLLSSWSLQTTLINDQNYIQTYSDTSLHSDSPIGCRLDSLWISF